MKKNETTLSNPRVIVAFEVAKKLFEMGFDEPCVQHYGNTSGSLYGNEWIPEPGKELHRNSTLDRGPYGNTAAPTIEQATNWLLLHAFGLKSEVQGFYGTILKSQAVDRTLMADFLFEMSKQVGLTSFENVTKIAGKSLTEIAVLLYPDVKLEDKFPGLQK